jgi:hypothetical protein
MGIQELLAYGVGTLVLLAALIYGTYQYQHRSKRLEQDANAIIKDRYQRRDL